MIIIFYSIAPILSAGLLFVFLKDDRVERDEGFKMSDFLNLIKNPALWLVVCITFCTYFFNMSFYYFTPYASNIIGTSAVFAAILTVLAQYIRPLSSTAGGFLADAFGKAKIMLVGFLIMGFGVLLIMMSAFLGGFAQMALLSAACVLVYAAMYSNFGIYYSLLSEGKIPLHLTGMAVGIVSTFGYLPEVFAPILAGGLLDSYEGVRGFHIYFGIMVAMSLLGAFFCRIWMKKFARKLDENR
ncbi:MFS transporter [Campylobacter sp.]|uniref:MFS transporter n=1 Tax=Campylobacter sp. TaxID=205 RepID=UPI0026DD56A5|nr:MFS transporter [Campylobacter sp.]MDO4674285.1 hypothetical protein [Campylobacter sp.]